METSREVNEVSDKIEEFWRDADGADVMRVMDGQRVEARFRDGQNTSWYLRKLSGWNTGAFRCDQSEGWKHCQVYDPPEWCINKPDPGEGWRLLEKFPPESLQAGDDWYCFGDKAWHMSFNVLTNCSTQTGDVWYRRRIANNPTILASSRSRDDIPSGWRLLGKDEERLASDAYWSKGCNEWLLIGDDRVAIANELNKWHAIRQVVFYDHLALQVNGVYGTPGGQTIRITAKGFEVG